MIVQIEIITLRESSRKQTPDSDHNEKPSEPWYLDEETKRKVDTGSLSLISWAASPSNPSSITLHSSISGVSGLVSDIGELELESEFEVVEGKVDVGSTDAAMGMTRLQHESGVNVSLWQ